jgi:predicted patatin/cPLA2 family phospholipase
MKNEAVKTGLIMEGGAMRGMFTSGVLDVFLENGITFDGAIGVSAGATFGCNYKSRQVGRALRYNKRFCADPRYGSVRSWLKTGDVFDVDFCYHVVPRELDVFDTKAFSESPMEFFCVATDVRTGEPVYHQCLDGGDEDLEWIRASASIPVASHIVEIDGQLLLDGGVADSIPLRFMEKRGYQKNVVILTQPLGYVKEPYAMMPVFRMALRQYPNMLDALGTRPDRYNEETAYVRRREQEGAAFVLRPPEPLAISATTTDPEELQRVYDVGRRVASERLDELL